MDQVIAYLKKLPHTEVKPGLARTLALLTAVGNPHRHLQTVHIGGTNGKGSVAAMLASVLQAAGYRVGLYISPHLVSYRERIQILDPHPLPSPVRTGEGQGGGWISEQDFVLLADELMPIADSMSDKPTQFEFLTALAFLHFARQRVEIAVIEVGLAGRFDATNVITPWVSVLTNVEFDHTDLLGCTIEQIAWEEAGIAKSNVPLVTGERKPAALQVIERECAAVGAPLIQPGFQMERRDFTWDYQEFAVASLGRVRLKLLGGYQSENLSVALGALRELQKQLAISNSVMIKGLESARWPGRFAVLQQEPYIIVLDGAHNPHAARALREDLRRYAHKYALQKHLLLFGVLQDKDYRQIAEVLFSEFDELFLVRPDSPRACEPRVLEQIACALRRPALVCESIATGLTAAQARAAQLAQDSSTLLCVTGSLYLVGAVLRERAL